MSLIHLYLDKENISSDLILLFRKQNIDFLQTNIANKEEYLKAYKIDQLPAIRFKDTLIYDTSKESVNKIINKFNDFIYSLPNINLDANDNDTTNNTDKPFKRINITEVRSDDKNKLVAFIHALIKSRI